MPDHTHGADVETCNQSRWWNNEPCSNPADVVINGVAVCSECAIRSGGALFLKGESK